MEIPLELVAILGLGASLKYAYKVFYNRDYKNIGALISTSYLTLVYTTLGLDLLAIHGSPLVRLGIVIVFIDKIIVFSYNLFQEIRIKRKNVKFTEFGSIGEFLKSIIMGNNEDGIR
jgi:hypothetical protein